VIFTVTLEPERRRDLALAAQRIGQTADARLG
jgi:hypothetical protein